VENFFLFLLKKKEREKGHFFHFYCGAYAYVFGGPICLLIIIYFGVYKVIYDLPTIFFIYFYFHNES